MVVAIWFIKLVYAKIIICFILVCKNTSLSVFSFIFHNSKGLSHASIYRHIDSGSRVRLKHEYH